MFNSIPGPYALDTVAPSTRHYTKKCLGTLPNAPWGENIPGVKIYIALSAYKRWTISGEKTTAQRLVFSYAKKESGKMAN